MTDQGSNMVKVIQDEELKRQFCLGHDIHNLINEDGFGYDKLF